MNNTNKAEEILKLLAKHGVEDWNGQLEGSTSGLLDAMEEYRQSEIDELTKEVERLRNLITKYAYHVSECEGVDFISNGWNESSYFTEYEWKTLQELRPKY